MAQRSVDAEERIADPRSDEVERMRSRQAQVDVDRARQRLLRQATRGRHVSGAQEPVEPCSLTEIGQ